jgi:hypothetical protein
LAALEGILSPNPSPEQARAKGRGAIGRSIVLSPAGALR